ncbi:FAD-dependent oxidoreductase [Nesterenkonia xinjiangensis]|uniref:Glycine/D-amino acid oxidase-like deaminating enzyme/nitrite reductase/ring-hydroxylating ferredoxin subunit n=1 Tax=Nesterenkonia xinjiangensis TaxID=225327 RepID=A0A7Z0KBB1_9MICC|nr:FAD-dependent oxidoreductase [Nesterenkonia xinjiangensis]NYJ79115.1 glycine/D-amino acid oxidase-like deaminating enzyme/nitrite reductase/ring-hydroxylating ferredoxin subunit [Nesterenkonia xinjiangensis]
MRSYWLDTSPTITPTNTGFISRDRYDVVVAGAGLTGLTTAVLLARAGKRVAVLEARSVGAVATGNTTAKLSLLQGSVLSGIREHQADDILRAYVEANREGQAWLLRHLDEHKVSYQRRDAFTYATTEDGVATLRRELEACQTAGLDAQWADATELPFEVAGAIRMPDQAQFHPMPVLQTLANELIDRDGELIEGVRVTGADHHRSLTVQTSAGDVEADHLVLATGVPVLDRGGHFATLSAHRSYALTFRLPEGSSPVQGMYLSVDSPDRTLRSVPAADGSELLLIGGNDHSVGRATSHSGAVADLETWAREHFPGAERTHAWSAQDYRSIHQLPLLGTLPHSEGTVFFATGFNKWGMTNGVAAALAITSQIHGHSPSWAEALSERVTSAADVATGFKDNLSTGMHMATGWASAELTSLPHDAPAERQGVVGQRHGRPLGVSTVEGTTCAVSAICPHMGGILRWNDAEHTWDCPLHASRFAPDGTRLEGPALHDLSRPHDEE